MTLYINTSSSSEIIIALFSGQKVLSKKKIKAPQHQAEKLVLSIAKLLDDNKIKLKDLKKIIVANQGGSFTSLRIGVITANTLAYALNIPVESENSLKEKNKKKKAYNIVKPLYTREAQVGKSKKSKI